MKFELNTLPRNCSKETIITEIRRVDSIVGKDILTTHDFNKFSKLKAASISKKFGSWEKALTAAGFGQKYSGIKITEKMRQQSKLLSDEQVLNELIRIATKLGQDYVTQENINIHSGIISGSTVVYRFGSWPDGVKKAGLKDSPGYLSTVVHGFSPEQFSGFKTEVKRLLSPQGRLAVVEIVKRATPFGPPLDRRLSPEDLKSSLDLIPLATVDVGEYFYMQIFGNIPRCDARGD